jgi:acyl-CoA synthetase (AMP-forming)/AMP-acid ligase II
MPHKSKYPDLEIPASNILDFIFPPNDPIPPKNSIWHDSINPSNSLSKSQGLHRIKQLAIALDNLGIKEQEVVMIFTPNHIYVPIAYMGIVGSKRIFSGANPIYTVNEIVYQIENTNAKALLVHPSLLDTAIAAAQNTNLSLNRIFQFNDSPSPASQGVQDWFSILRSDAATSSYQWPKLNPDEAKTTIATINYSSGTTGLPKGVMISHRNLIANVMQTVYMRDQEMPYNPKGVYRPEGAPQERWSESVWILPISEQEQAVLPYFAFSLPCRKHAIALVTASVLLCAFPSYFQNQSSPSHSNTNNPPTNRRLPPSLPCLRPTLHLLDRTSPRRKGLRDAEIRIPRLPGGTSFLPSPISKLITPTSHR